jgi:uncharacterized protein (TIGR02270 family)
MVIDHIVSQHAEQAAFLWVLRDAAIYAPHYNLRDLDELDERLNAHLDGLRVAADAGWNVCRETLLSGGAGEIFAASVLAFESGEEARIVEVIEVGITRVELAFGVVSALGWLDYRQAEKHIRKFLFARAPMLRDIGIEACTMHRQDPGRSLIDALSDDDSPLKARVLRAVGQLGRADLLPFLQNNLAVADVVCRFAAAWSGALLGDTRSQITLKSIAGLDGSSKEDAATVALRSMDLAAAVTWQKELAEKPESGRLAVVGAGVIGDPAIIPWLIEQMKVPELARVAGESFTMITGVDIAYEDLEGEKPEGFESGPTEDPEDENVEMDPDENLPWPNPELIQKWWSNHRSNFQSGTRYLIGKPIAEEWLQQVLRIGRQRQRAAAALELVLKRPGQPLFEVRAPGFRQQQLLGLKK